MVGPVVDRGRGMTSLGMVDSVVNGMVGSWATSGKKDFHVGNKYKFFLTSVVPQIEPSLAANTSFCCFDKTGILTSDEMTVFWKYQRLPSILSSLVVWWMVGKNEGPPGCDSVCALFCMVEKIFS